MSASCGFPSTIGGTLCTRARTHTQRTKIEQINARARAPAPRAIYIADDKCARTCTHTHTYLQTTTCTQPRRARMHAPMHATHARTHALTHALTQEHTHTHARKHARARAHDAHDCTAHKHGPTHARTDACTHASTPAHQRRTSIHACNIHNGLSSLRSAHAYRQAPALGVTSCSSGSNPPRTIVLPRRESSFVVAGERSDSFRHCTARTARERSRRLAWG